MYTFDWDENKNHINQKKHGISFVEACSVFFDERIIKKPFTSYRMAAMRKMPVMQKC